jgi:threonine dehydrogenase-like Zn-dependent dehydrogenase
VKALTWQGKRDIAYSEVPDPAIQQPTDAIVRVTSTGICGSDLHLYEVMAPYLEAGDVLGHETIGIVAEVREQGMGAALFGYTKLYGQIPGGQAEYLRVPQAQYGPIKVPAEPPDDRFVYLSDVLPTAWQAVEYADVPPGGTLLVLGLGPIGDMAARIALHRSYRVIGIDLVPERLERARQRGIETLEYSDDVADVVRELTDGRGADSVIDAVGMEADGRGRSAGRVLPGDRRSTPRRHDLADRRVRRDGGPAADADDLRQAAPAPDGVGEREALGRPDPAALGQRRSARGG